MRDGGRTKGAEGRGRERKKEENGGSEMNS